MLDVVLCLAGPVANPHALPPHQITKLKDIHHGIPANHCC